MKINPPMQGQQQPRNSSSCNEIPLRNEATLAEDNNVLLLFRGAKLEYLALQPGERFFGAVHEHDNGEIPPDLVGRKVFVMGDVAQARGEWVAAMAKSQGVFIVRDLCVHFPHGRASLPNTQVVGLGRLPISVHEVGVLYREYFEDGNFQQIQTDHAFQALKFSNVPSVALRTGIYLTPVEYDAESDEKRFRLLRCSTNLAGPTADFRSNDHSIVNALNAEACSVFKNAAPLNHVLAQIYHNTYSERSNKRKKSNKASIKAHADKTKDMPRNGVMAFCTFYDDVSKLQPIGAFDCGHKGVSGLTSLKFRLKELVSGDSKLAQEFSVTLYPNSVFFMSLSANRLYTHEIRPGSLDAPMLPTRLGYVVRCAATEAVHKKIKSEGGDGPESATFIKLKSGEWVPLEPPTAGGLRDLHLLYKQENVSDKFIDYGDRFLFSMNNGDYARPITYNVRGGREEFRKLEMEAPSDLFERVMAATQFESLGKGRQGKTLVLPDEENRIPVVRTTTNYKRPAQRFQPIHESLALRIQQRAGLPVSFNNILAEVYDNEYTKMGFHSDQAQDLLDGTYVAIFSCYENPDLPQNRMLVVEPKDGNKEGDKFTIGLTHNSVVLFSLGTNQRFRHKIVLEKKKDSQAENRWLGLTFRTSKTFIQIKKGLASFSDGTPLKLAANDHDRAAFYKMRGCENREVGFRYPFLDFTLSESDLMAPEE